jgi:hypothetical protein
VEEPHAEEDAEEEKHCFFLRMGKQCNRIEINK